MYLSISLRVAIIYFAFTSIAIADVDNGEELHTESCVSCHMMPEHTALYSQPDRKVDSLHRLGGQVSACTQILNITWFPEDERDVVEYLNNQFYKFPQ